MAQLNQSPKKIFVNQSYTPIGTNTPIAPGATLALPLDVFVLNPGQVEVQLNISVRVPMGQTVIENIDYNFLRDGSTITQGIQYLAKNLVSDVSTDDEFLFDTVMVDQTAPVGTHNYIAQIINNGTVNVLIDNYAFVVIVGGDGCQPILPPICGPVCGPICGPVCAPVCRPICQPSCCDSGNIYDRDFDHIFGRRCCDECGDYDCDCRSKRHDYKCNHRCDDRCRRCTHKCDNRCKRCDHKCDRRCRKGCIHKCDDRCRKCCHRCDDRCIRCTHKCDDRCRRRDPCCEKKRCDDRCDDRCNDKCRDRCYEDKCRDRCCEDKWRDRCCEDKCRDRCCEDRCCEDRCCKDRCCDLIVRPGCGQIIDGCGGCFQQLPGSIYELQLDNRCPGPCPLPCPLPCPAPCPLPPINNKCKSIQANQLFTPINQLSATITPSNTLTLPIDTVVNSNGQVSLELNLSTHVLAQLAGQINVQYNFLRDGQSLTQGPQYFFQLTVPSLPIGDDFDLTDDVVFVDINAAPGTHTYAVQIINSGTLTFNINNYSFIVVNVCKKQLFNNPSICNPILRIPVASTCPNELVPTIPRTITVNEVFTPIDVEIVLPPVTNNIMTISIDSFVTLLGQVQLEFNTNLLFSEVGTYEALYNISRDGVSLTGNQFLVLRNSAIFPIRANADVVYVDTTAPPGAHVYTITITNTGAVNLNLDNYAFIATTSGPL